MSVVVAHQASATGRLIIEEAAKGASLRHTSMSVVHVAEGVDIDMIEDQKMRLRNEITNVLEGANWPDVEWTLQVATGVDVAETVLNHIDGADVELLVIGARRRSPVGKLIMGSVTQSILLRANVPVLVVKAQKLAPRASPERSRVRRTPSDRRTTRSFGGRPGTSSTSTCTWPSRPPCPSSTTPCPALVAGARTG